jgi:prepilin-type N-terminal cleavage/methylation domain-containing protein
VQRREKGFSAIESMVVIVIATILMAFVMPNFRGLIQGSRRNGAAELIAADVRKARARAIATGWQYRVYGFNASAASPYKNQYRIMGRSSSAAGWPADTVPPMQSATQMAGKWVNIGTLYPGVNLNPVDVTDHFWIAYDSRGVRIELDPSFDPLVVTNGTGTGRSIRTSAVGSVKIE